MEQERKKEVYRVTFVGTVVNMVLVVAKFVAGILGHSGAMIADAVHSLSDFVTDIVVLVMVGVSSKPQDADHHYGHGKYETLATVVIGLALMLAGIGICYSGVSAIVAVLSGEQLPAPGYVALVAAIISILSKEILFRYTINVGKRVGSPAVVANAWHHRSDALSSIATMVGIGGAILLGEEWRVLDPIAAIFVSVFVMKVAYDLMRPCVGELLEKSLPKEVEDEIMAIILSFEQVSSPHHLRTRRIGTRYAIEFHVRMAGETSLSEAHAVATEIEAGIKARYGQGTHVAVHMEPEKRE